MNQKYTDLSIGILNFARDAIAADTMFRFYEAKMNCLQNFNIPFIDSMNINCTNNAYSMRGSSIMTLGNCAAVYKIPICLFAYKFRICHHLPLPSSFVQRIIFFFFRFAFYECIQLQFVVTTNSQC